MSAFNWFNTRKRAFEQRTHAITTSATVTTYTARVGSSNTNNFIVDRVINVTTAASCNITITVPNGVYEGQRILINHTAEGSAETVTITTTTGGDYAFTDIGAYCSLEWVNSTAGWVALANSNT